MSGVIWSGNDESDYRYYALLGLNYFNFGEDAGYPAGENEQTTQVVFGLGVGKKVAKNYQFRADMRLMGGHDVDAEDVGFQISLNRFLGDASAPVRSSPIASPAAKESTVKTITINLNVEFEFDKATVMSIYSDQLATVAKALSMQPPSNRPYPLSQNPTAEAGTPLKCLSIVNSTPLNGKPISADSGRHIQRPTVF